MNKLVQVLLKGLAVVVPIGVTLYVVWWMGVGLEKLLGPAIAWTLPDQGTLAYRPGMGIAAGIVLVFLIGLLTGWVLFRRLVALAGRLLERIPLVKSLYGGVSDLMGFVSGGGARKEANQVVLIEAGPDCRLLGFITQDDPRELPAGLGEGQEETVAVYLPMSYQLGGFTVFVPRRRVEPVDMSIEEAMRYALTAGVSRNPDGKNEAVQQIDRIDGRTEDGQPNDPSATDPAR